MKRILLLSFVILVSFAFSLSTGESASAQTVKKVMWGNSEVKAGEIGKISLLKDADLYNSRTKKKMKTLKKGQEYAVYSKNTAQFNLGGGAYVKVSPNVKYQTISKAKLTEFYQANLPQTIASARSLTELGNVLKSAGWYYVDVKNDNNYRSLTAVQTMYTPKFVGVDMQVLGGYTIYTQMDTNTNPIILDINKRYLELVGVKVGSNYSDIVKKQSGSVTWGNLSFNYGYYSPGIWGFSKIGE